MSNKPYDQMVIPTGALRSFLRLSIRQELKRSGVSFVLPTTDELDSFIQRESMRIPLGAVAALEMFVGINERIHEVYTLVDGLLRELLPNDEALKNKMAKVIEELEEVIDNIYLSDAEFKAELEETFRNEHGNIENLLICLAQDNLLVDNSMTSFNSLPPDTKARFLSTRE